MKINVGSKKNPIVEGNKHSIRLTWDFGLDHIQ